MGRGAAPFQTTPKVFRHFLSLDNPGRELVRMVVLHIHDANEYTLCPSGGKYYGSGLRRIATGKKKHSTGFFGSTV